MSRNRQAVNASGWHVQANNPHHAAPEQLWQYSCEAAGGSGVCKQTFCKQTLCNHQPCWLYQTIPAATLVGTATSQGSTQQQGSHDVWHKHCRQRVYAGTKPGAMWHTSTAHGGRPGGPLLWWPGGRMGCVGMSSPCHGLCMVGDLAQTPPPIGPLVSPASGTSASLPLRTWRLLWHCYRVTT